MKYLFILLFVFISNMLAAQVKSNYIYKSWVVSKITFKDGTVLPDEHPLKYTYFKYTFTYPDKFNPSVAFYELGDEKTFEINNNDLIIKSPQGGFINSYHIEPMKDTLVLIQQDQNGSDDPNLLKYYFVPEEVYKSSIKLKPSDIYSIRASDTIYKESPKIYSMYKGSSFQRFVYNGIKDRISMDNRVGHFVATFTVSKTGLADSVKILEGIDEEFNKRFIKVFNQAKKDWKPAMLNEKPVSVQMEVELRYSTSSTTIPAYSFTQKANKAYNGKNYELAVFYYDQALKSVPTDKDNLYKRGMCKLLLGNKNGACEDWNKIKFLGGSGAVDVVLEKYCN